MIQAEKAAGAGSVNEGTHVKSQFWDLLRDASELEVSGNLKKRVEWMFTDIEKGSLKKGSYDGYVGAIRRYKEWCRLPGNVGCIRSWPPTVQSLALYLHFCWKEKKSYAAMRQCYFAVNWYAKVEGWAGFASCGVISRLLRAAALDLYESKNRKHALSRDQVLALLEMTGCLPAGEEWEEVRLILTMQYEGIARVSEILSRVREDVTFRNTYTALYYKGKTHAMRLGEYKFFRPWSEGERFNATVLLSTHLQKRGMLRLPPASPKWGHPLIARANGKEVTYSWLRKKLVILFKACGMNPVLFCTHSLRSGAASAAFARGMSRDQIKRAGGWVSEAVDLYILPTSKQVLAVPEALAFGVKRRKIG